METSDHSGAAELSESRLYTFIDEAREFAIYFLEGQKLIQDLALRQGVKRHGFAYFRDVVLSIQPMIALLKAGEQLGFYIDSEEPLFRLKIESSHAGAMRSVLVPDDFAEFPATMRGMVRVQKLFPNNRSPYQSVLEVADQPLRAIVNHVLRESYQVNCVTMLSDVSDQSLMLHQLPPLNSEEYEYSLESVRARRAELAKDVETIFQRALQGHDELDDAFKAIGFRMLASREVRFQCSCSQERLLHSLQLAAGDDVDGLFDPGQERLEITCEYCKTRYEVSREELRQYPTSPN